MRIVKSGAIAILLAGVSTYAMAQSDLPHNSTTGAASTDQPNPPTVVHIMSPGDAAKYNPVADADDKKPTMAHALALTDEQRRLILGGFADKAGNPGTRAEFKPEVAALMPSSAKVTDLPAAITGQMPWVKQFKYAAVDGKIMLVDPVNSYMVVAILNE